MLPHGVGTPSAYVQISSSSPNAWYSAVSTAALANDRASYWTVRIMQLPSPSLVSVGIVGAAHPAGNGQSPTSSHQINSCEGQVEGTANGVSQVGDELVFVFIPVERVRLWASCSADQGEAARLLVHHKRHGWTTTITLPAAEGY